MKRKTLIISIALITTLAISGSVAASDTFNSKGTINIDADSTTDGYEVIIDSNDLAVLDSRIDELDTLVTEGKNELTNSVNAYPHTDIAYMSTFDVLATSIDNLTTVPTETYYYDTTTVTTDASELVRYVKEDGKYYLCGVGGNKLSLTEQFPDQSNLIEYKEITEEDLNVGTAGYVDKNIILGNGSAYIAAYNEGWLDGQRNATENLEIQYTYHAHSGDATNGSGCYSAPVYHSHTGNSSSGGGCYTVRHTSSAYWTNNHTHGNSYTGVPDSCRTCSRCGGHELYGHSLCSTTTYSIGCGKDGSVIESYILNCGKTEGSIESATIKY